MSQQAFTDQVRSFEDTISIKNQLLRDTMDKKAFTPFDEPVTLHDHPKPIRPVEASEQPQRRPRTVVPLNTRANALVRIQKILEGLHGQDRGAVLNALFALEEAPLYKDNP